MEPASEFKTRHFYFLGYVAMLVGKLLNPF